MTAAPLTYGTAFPATRPVDQHQGAQAPSHRSLFARVLDAISDSNRRKADREVARYIERNGGKLTDEIERAVERSFR
jgi:hypothetical protein